MDKTTLEKTHSDLLCQAAQRPGVREAMEIYAEWRKYDRAIAPSTHNPMTGKIVSSSNSQGTCAI